MPPIITIFGATGTQGSAVLEAVLADGKYTPRAVSRSLDSTQSKALIARGVEVVVGNLWDKESLKDAIRGSDAVFGNTNFWSPDVFPADPQGKGEITQGKNLVDAAKEVGVKFFIYSSLPSATKESNGEFKHLYHLDNKAAIEDHLRASGVPFACLGTASFTENLWNFGYLKKTDTGYTVPIPIVGPDSIHAQTWIGHDLGQAAVALLTHYTDPSKNVLGKFYPVVSFRCTYPELAKAIAGAIKKEVTFTHLETSGMKEGDAMYAYAKKFGIYNSTPVPNPDLVALGVKFGTLEEFLQAEVVPRYA
ncbi:NmrA domain-containing protein [Mycena venus]|uniref:NmrA domain-containing protein n=1 Tax=Mycena venus TaxID=2733690 RepID=A0A8H7CP96_9AGAR|nr:NmrA domain-containing protein [Mycena venus]